jgi:membrane protease YdiL (CAAX protease family)
LKLIPEVFNALLFALLLFLPLVEARRSWPRYLKKLATSMPGARLRYFRKLLVGEWLLTLAFIASWALSGRPWDSLMLNHVTPIQSWIFLFYAGLFIFVFWRQRRTILARPATVERLRKRLEFAKPLLPHTPAERRLFWAVSATAGICEETLYRGFLTWYIVGLIGTWITPFAEFWAGPTGVFWIAVVLSSLIFGLGHIYLGIKQVPRTFLIGLVLASLTWFSGSLWPSIVLHAAIDWNSGELGFAILNHPPTAPLEPASSTERV